MKGPLWRRQETPEKWRCQCLNAADPCHTDMRERSRRGGDGRSPGLPPGLRYLVQRALALRGGLTCLSDYLLCAKGGGEGTRLASCAANPKRLLAGWRLPPVRPMCSKPLLVTGACQLGQVLTSVLPGLSSSCSSMFTRLSLGNLLPTHAHAAGGKKKNRDPATKIEPRMAAAGAS